MNPLVHRLPQSLVIDSKHYKIDTSHRAWVNVARILSDEIDDLSLALVCKAISLEPPNEPQGLIEAITDFLSAGQEKSKGGKRVFDWDEDAHRVIAAFQHDYGIDLTAENMHWYRFMYLFNGLSKDTELVQAISWRSTPRPKDSKHNKDELARWKSIQKVYKLKPRTAEQRRAEIESEW